MGTWFAIVILMGAAAGLCWLAYVAWDIRHSERDLTFDDLSDLFD